MRLVEHDNTKRDYRRARSLRNDASPFEKKLWVHLREQAKLQNLKFRRQQPIHPYIADFACMDARLIVELDGVSHDEKLEQMGYAVLRFRNQDVSENLEHVVDTILNHAAKKVHAEPVTVTRRAPLPNPPREGEGIL